MAGLADVMQNCRAADFAGVVDQQIAEPEYALRNTGGNGDVLNLAEWDIASGAGNQTRVDLNF